ncbi:sigma-Y antisigma factor component [Bacillus sp. HMF5848]|uniref:sigma-Y antisigma factor component n=1 Tax=Bacillus sp. HMF5848 TaxID=2495421 RepID=UPI000F7A3036|nr:sigma-Y antisigma factor component [Bacillus sp. HMF5848]RSK28691.1 sigma-Y antisigma factor component [Bacillus sp. HMF5848]
MTEQELKLLPIVIIILLAQSTWLYLDARKHGHNKWIWGIVGLVQAPMPTLFYLLFIRKVFRKGRVQ